MSAITLPPPPHVGDSARRTVRHRGDFVQNLATARRERACTHLQDNHVLQARRNRRPAVVSVRPCRDEKGFHTDGNPLGDRAPPPRGLILHAYSPRAASARSSRGKKHFSCASGTTTTPPDCGRR
ncbi:hypothetical protein HPB50_009236 [Hyalomma asiaticum]|uniref:Uncharacterized protein n=1 Tax=Hyalomma asiaticum TaxID=266040 RepID=A0ACB7T6Y0_HYAAI|nr:hypothetical protein HPB50_009236 [Hyalomma asiaticum]